MKKEDIEVVEKTTDYKGYARMDVYRLRHRLYAGGWSDVLRREILERGHAVAVLLYDPDRDEVVMLEQFRIGMMSALESPWWGDDVSPWMVEVVAGIVEEGEEAEEVARREAVEEAGCEVREMVEIARWLPTPGICSETVILYCGRVDATGVGGIHGLIDEGEDIRVMAVPADEVLGWLDAGHLQNATAIIAFQWLRAMRDELRRSWCEA